MAVYLVTQTNGVSPNKKADYPFRQSTLLFGLHAVFCLIELSRVTCWTVEFQSVFLPQILSFYGAYVHPQE